MNWYKIVNCKSQTKLRFLILIFVNIEIFTPWAMAAFGGAPNGKRVTSGTIKKLNPKLSICHFWVHNPNGTKFTQTIVHSPTAVYVCSRFPNEARPV